MFRLNLKNRKTYKRLLSLMFAYDPMEAPQDLLDDCVKLRRHVVNRIGALSSRKENPRTVTRLRAMFTLLGDVDAALRRHERENARVSPGQYMTNEFSIKRTDGVFTR